MRNRVSILVLFISLCLLPPALLYASYWSRTYGGNGMEEIYDAKETQDGGYILVGTTRKESSGNYDIWILRLDERGDILWQKAYDTGGDDYAHAVQETSDGYIVVGETNNCASGNLDVFILKLDKDGGIAWTKVYGGNKNEYLYAVGERPDEGYIVAGETESFSNNNAEVWVLSLKKDGSIDWQKRYGASGSDDVAYSLNLTEDSYCVLAGYSGNYALVLKLDSDGNVLWQKKYGVNNNDAFAYLYSIDEDLDGGYIAAGAISSGTGGNAWAIDLDKGGDIRWQRRYTTGVENYFYIGSSLTPSLHGGYILASLFMRWPSGQIGDFGDSYMQVFALDDYGNISAENAYRLRLWNYLATVREVDSGSGYLFAGYTTFDSGQGDRDAWVLKLDNTLDVVGCDAYQADFNTSAYDTTITPEDAGLEVNVTNAEEISDVSFDSVDLSYIEKDEQCTAYLLSLTVGEGGSVAVGSSATECRGVCNSAYAMGDSVALTASPEDGYVFKEWGGGCSSCETNLDCSIQMDADEVCAATFDKVSGNGGDNGSNGGGSNGGSGGGSSGGGGGGSSSGGGGGCSLQRR